METGKTILVVGIVGVIGVFGYLYLKNSKKTSGTTGDKSGGNPLTDLIDSIIPPSEDTAPSPSQNENTPPPVGSSNVNKDPLSTTKTDTVSDIQKEEADAYILKLAKEKEAKKLSAEITQFELDKIEEEKKIKRGYTNIARRPWASLINSRKRRLKELGYMALSNGGIQPI